MLVFLYFVFFFKQKTAYEMRISDWSSDVCSSDLVTRYVEGVESDYVGNDNRLASMLATQHLLELGHEKIAYLGRNRLTSTGRDRFEGFMAAMKKADLKVANDWAIDCPASREDGYRETVKVLRVRKAPKALICFNDTLAFGAMLGLRSLGLEPGAD